MLPKVCRIDHKKFRVCAIENCPKTSWAEFPLPLPLPLSTPATQAYRVVPFQRKRKTKLWTTNLTLFFPFLQCPNFKVKRIKGQNSGVAWHIILQIKNRQHISFPPSKSSTNVRCITLLKYISSVTSTVRPRQTRVVHRVREQGHPTAIFGKISVRKTIWELEFSEHLL